MAKINPKTMTDQEREQLMERWYEIREKENINAAAAAAKLGVTYQSLHKWEIARTGQHGTTGRPKKDGKKVVRKLVFTPPQQAEAGHSAAPPTGANAKPAEAPKGAEKAASVAPAAPVASASTAQASVAPASAAQAVKPKATLASEPAVKAITVTTPNGFVVVCPDIETARALIS